MGSTISKLARSFLFLVIRAITSTLGKKKQLAQGRTYGRNQGTGGLDGNGSGARTRHRACMHGEEGSKWAPMGSRDQNPRE